MILTTDFWRALAVYEAAGLSPRRLAATRTFGHSFARATVCKGVVTALPVHAYRNAGQARENERLMWLNCSLLPSCLERDQHALIPSNRRRVRYSGAQGAAWVMKSMPIRAASV